LRKAGKQASWGDQCTLQGKYDNENKRAISGEIHIRVIWPNEKELMTGAKFSISVCIPI
jgi:hypothetical protein